VPNFAFETLWTYSPVFDSLILVCALQVEFKAQNRAIEKISFCMVEMIR
jgi:hypothetical protein